MCVKYQKSVFKCAKCNKCGYGANAPTLPLYVPKPKAK